MNAAAKLHHLALLPLDPRPAKKWCEKCGEHKAQHRVDECGVVTLVCDDCAAKPWDEIEDRNR